MATEATMLLPGCGVCFHNTYPVVAWIAYNVPRSVPMYSLGVRTQHTTTRRKEVR